MNRIILRWGILLACALGFYLGACDQKQEGTLPVPENHLGLQIQEARMTTGVSQAALAKAVGLSPQHIQTIESGKAVPTRDIIVDIEEVLGIEIIYDQI